MDNYQISHKESKHVLKTFTSISDAKAYFRHNLYEHSWEILPLRKDQSYYIQIQYSILQEVKNQSKLTTYSIFGSQFVSYEGEKYVEGEAVKIFTKERNCWEEGYIEKFLPNAHPSNTQLKHVQCQLIIGDEMRTHFTSMQCIKLR